MSEDGYIFWPQGAPRFSLAQFRDNVLLATDLPPGSTTTLVHDAGGVRHPVKHVGPSGPMPLCGRGPAAVCWACLSASVRALGANSTVGAGCGLACTHPSALKHYWAVRHKKPLITPGKAPPEYLPGIFTSSLARTMTWQWVWSSRILFALAWAQVGMFSDYPRMVVMRALHKGECTIFWRFGVEVLGTS